MPHTLPEWQQYIASLPSERLGQELALANSYTFVKTLQQEGLDMASIRQIVALLASRASKEGVLLCRISTASFRSLGDIDGRALLI